MNPTQYLQELKAIQHNFQITSSLHASIYARKRAVQNLTAQLTPSEAQEVLAWGSTHKDVIRALPRHIRRFAGESLQRFLECYPTSPSHPCNAFSIPACTTGTSGACVDD